jgi:hypothetical protein
VDSLQRVAHGLTQLGDLEAGIGGVPATVVEEVTDIVSLEYLDEALVLRPVFLQALEFETAGSEGPRWGRGQSADGGGALLAGIDQVLSQGADNSVAAGVNPADAGAVFPGGFDDTAGGGVDDGPPDWA